MKRQILIVIAVLLTALSSHAVAAPSAELWPLWTQSNESSAAEIDHSVWQGFLDRYLSTQSRDGIYRVRYQAVTAADRQTLTWPG